MMSLNAEFRSDVYYYMVFPPYRQTYVLSRTSTIKEKKVIQYIESGGVLVLINF